MSEVSAERSSEVTFGKYRLLRKIGTGGMASIFLATLDGPDGFKKQLVIKRVHPHLAELTEFNQMFATEAKVAALLSHPNIVQVYEYGTIGDSPYLAMEWLDGLSLEVLLRGARKSEVPLGPDFALQVGAQVCEALEYAHRLQDEEGRWLGLVHRDVSLSNVLIGFDGGVKLVDFGIAKITQAPSLTQTGTLKGKLAYMSPEQLTGAIDQRSDIFSLGIVLYEIAVGKRLFKRQTDAETVTAIARCEVPHPAEIVPGFPQDLADVLERALQRDPDKRFANAGEMGEAIEGILRDRRSTPGRRELAKLLSALPFELSSLVPSGSPVISGSSSPPPSSPSSPSSPPSSSGRRERSDPIPHVQLPASHGSSPHGVDPVWAILGGSAVLAATILLWWFLLG